MNVSWRLLSWSIWGGAAALGGLAVAGLVFGLPWDDPAIGPAEAQSPAVALPEIPQATKTTTATLPLPTSESIAAAARVRLGRIEPAALSEPTPPPPPPVVAPSAPLFTGSVVGTIVDSDPTRSYAILRWPDGHLQLVTTGQALTDAATSPTVEAIDEGLVRLRTADRVQELSAPTADERRQP